MTHHFWGALSLTRHRNICTDPFIANINREESWEGKETKKMSSKLRNGKRKLIIHMGVREKDQFGLVRQKEAGLSLRSRVLWRREPSGL